ncbi:hypothetical protein K502DRAFT_323033 [Neoconidiobolus thromboides FSU 785]|nr:hypothetical protein K502DRAFT_323033 [Neoconidiobolus thromboides FSU 785]
MNSQSPIDKNFAYSFKSSIIVKLNQRRINLSILSSNSRKLLKTFDIHNSDFDDYIPSKMRSAFISPINTLSKVTTFFHCISKLKPALGIQYLVNHYSEIEFSFDYYLPEVISTILQTFNLSNLLNDLSNSNNHTDLLRLFTKNEKFIIKFIMHFRYGTHTDFEFWNFIWFYLSLCMFNPEFIHLIEVEELINKSLRLKKPTNSRIKSDCESIIAFLRDIEMICQIEVDNNNVITNNTGLLDEDDNVEGYNNFGSYIVDGKENVDIDSIVYLLKYVDELPNLPQTLYDLISKAPDNFAFKLFTEYNQRILENDEGNTEKGYFSKSKLEYKYYVWHEIKIRCDYFFKKLINSIEGYNSSNNSETKQPILTFDGPIYHIGNIIPSYDVKVNRELRDFIKNETLVILFSREKSKVSKYLLYSTGNESIHQNESMIFGIIYYNTDHSRIQDQYYLNPREPQSMRLTIISDSLDQIDISKEYYIVLTHINYSYYKLIIDNEDRFSKSYLAKSFDTITTNLLCEIKNTDLRPNYLRDVKIPLNFLFENQNNLRASFFLKSIPDYQELNELSNMLVDESQFNAIKFILSNKIAVTAGDFKTGKTDLAIITASILASKLKELQFPEPVVIITNSDSKLYKIVDKLSIYFPDIVCINSEQSEIPENIQIYNIDNIANKSWDRIEKNTWNKIQFNKENLLDEWDKITFVKERIKDTSFSINAFIKLLPPHLANNIFHSDQPERFKSHSGTNELEKIMSWLEYESTVECIEPMNDLTLIIDLKDLATELDTNLWSYLDTNLWDLSLVKRREVFVKFEDILLRCIQLCYNRIVKELNKVYTEVEKLKYGIWRKVLNTVSIIVFTNASFTENYSILQHLNVRVGIILETEKFSDSKLLTLTNSLSLEHLILFANPSQLNPFSYFGNLKYRNYWEFSLVKRLFSTESIRTTLSNCYTKNSALLPIVSNLHPKSKLTIDHHPLTSLKGVAKQLSFVNVSSMKHAIWFNTVEAKFIARFVIFLYQQGYTQDDIAIFSLSYSQGKIIIEALLKMFKVSEKHQLLDREKIGLLPTVYSPGYEGGGTFKIVVVSLIFGRELRKNDNISCVKFVKSALFSSLESATIFGDESCFSNVKEWVTFMELLKASGNVTEYLELRCQRHTHTVNKVDHDFAFDKVCEYGGCLEKCDQRLACGHMCSLLCHPWFHDNLMCQKPCNRRKIYDCGHMCINKCFECKEKGCPPCVEKVNARLPCNHTFKVQCSKKLVIDDIECQELVIIKLPGCGHDYTIECFKSNNDDILSRIKCREKVEKELECGHIISGTCYKDISCNQVCLKKLECGHFCQSKCGTTHSHDRKYCKHDCPKVLLCGHMCQMGCSLPNKHTQFCKEKCKICCPHKVYCPKLCYEACIECIEPCIFGCRHQICQKSCSELCDRLPCQRRCDKVFDCNHQCVGFCGEPCPPCNKCISMECPISLHQLSDINLDNNELLYMLPDCNCVYLASYLDNYFKFNPSNNDDTIIKIWSCPKCQKNIISAPRYESYIKKGLNDFYKTKTTMLQGLNSLTNKEKDQIILAMASTVDLEVYDIVGGRWFKCPNSHPYYIGECGGATEISNCPECNEVIGGTKHKIVSSNAFFGEFDHSEKPAWPGQE